MDFREAKDRGSKQSFDGLLRSRGLRQCDCLKMLAKDLEVGFHEIMSVEQIFFLRRSRFGRKQLTPYIPKNDTRTLSRTTDCRM